MIKLLCLSWLFIGAINLSWEQFDASKNFISHEEVVIRGFIYQSKSGDWILSPEPNLRSCCVGTAHKASQQLVLEGDFSTQTQHKIVALRGIIGKQKDRNILFHASVEEQNSFPWYMATFLGVSTLSLIGYFIQRRLFRILPTCKQN